MTIHRVQSGETLASIAAQYGISVDALVEWNNLRNPDVIFVGERLVVSQVGGDQAASSDLHVVRRGETLSSIARAYGTTVGALKQANNLKSSAIFVGQRLKVPSDDDASFYEVKRGDTLVAIAKQLGTTVAALMELNDIADASLITVGQKLRTGVGGSTPQAAPAGPKLIVVDISEQRCSRLEGEKVLNTWRCSTGMNNATKTGRFKVQSKLTKAYGSKWNIWMPYWLGIYWAGPVENGFHGIPWNAKNGRKIWAGLVGRPATFGCVMLRDGPMKKLWEWADIGTEVWIRR